MSTGSATAWNMPNRLNFLTVVPMFHCNGWGYAWTAALIHAIVICCRYIVAKDIYNLSAGDYFVIVSDSLCIDTLHFEVENYNIENFQVVERGTLEDVIEAGAFQATIDDAEPERDNLQ